MTSMYVMYHVTCIVCCVYGVVCVGAESSSG